MGVSSAGYLGGKIVRKPGPVIDQIVARSGSLTLDVIGRCLSKNAGFQIEGMEITVSLIEPTVAAPVAGTTDMTRDAELVVVRWDDTSTDPATYAAELRLTLADPVGWSVRHNLPPARLSPAALTNTPLPVVPAPVLVPAPAHPAPTATQTPPPAVPPVKATLTITNPDGQMAVWAFDVQPG